MPQTITVWLLNVPAFGSVLTKVDMGQYYTKLNMFSMEIDADG
ncbi:Hypothetical protein A7982_10627 [Minicystis rosea]|nr:Hypothetical protein A7982_10627 [Minicystis rosea]